MFEKVVSYVDGSSDGWEALRQAALVRRPGGQLLGVVVCDRGLAAGAGFEATHAARLIEEEAERTRAEAVAALADAPDASVEVVLGRPSAALVAIAERAGAGLLVVGTHRSGRRLGVGFGSLLTELVQRVRCSVLVARRGAADPWRPTAVAVGVDGSPCSLVALEAAREVAERLGVDVRIVAATGGKGIDREALRLLGEVELDDRKPVESLIAAGAESGLVVVGTRGLHGLTSLGSVAERVAHRSVCSVLVARRPDSDSERA